MKLVMAFLGGAALAGSVLYVALRPAEPISQAEKTEFTSPPIPAPSEPAVPAAPGEAPDPAEELMAANVAAPRQLTKPSTPKKARLPFQPPAATQRSAEPVELPMPPLVAPPEKQPLPVMLTSSAEIPAPPDPNRVTLAPGTILHVRLSEDLSSEINEAGDEFTASLDEPLIVDGFVIAERHSRAVGQVIGAQRSGKVKGSAVLILQLTQFETSDGQKIEIQSDSFTKQAKGEAVKDAAKVGAAASIGAVIGAVTGGGKGAAIGAAIGGAAGTGGVLMTRGEPATLPAETRIPFRLSTAVTITEQIH